MGLYMKQTVWFCLFYLGVIGNISVLKILDEFLSRQKSEKLSEIFFDEVYPTKICLTKFFAVKVL